MQAYHPVSRGDARMKTNCAVSFEFTTRPPLTWRGQIEGFAPHTIMHRAVNTAMKDLQPRSWSSVSAVILDRDDTPEGGEGVALGADVGE